MPPARVSVVTVYNDRAMLDECLRASLAGAAPAVELIAVDNTDHAFASAGAALNHGATQATGAVLAFVHQDVFLHSTERLLAAAQALLDGGWAVLGASGVDAEGRWIGRLRDRVQLIGEPAATPRPVRTLDEVAFLVARERIRQQPLTLDPDLAWHAYAVEYALRAERDGELVGAVDLEISHNSRSVNLDRLDVAHRRIGELFPDALPVRTTVGLVGQRRHGWRTWPGLKQHRWRLNWLRRSFQAHRLRQAGIAAPVVFGDIRHDVDRLAGGDVPVQVINVDRAGTFAASAPTPTALTRDGRPFTFTCVDNVDALASVLTPIAHDAPVVVTELTLADVVTVVRASPGRRWRIGLQPGSVWMVAGAAADVGPESWTTPRAQPSPTLLRVLSRAAP